MSFFVYEEICDLVPEGIKKLLQDATFFITIQTQVDAKVSKLTGLDIPAAGEEDDVDTSLKIPIAYLVTNLVKNCININEYRAYIYLIKSI